MRKGGRGWGKDRSVDMDNVAWWGCKEEGWGLVLRKVRGGGEGGELVQGRLVSGYPGTSPAWSPCYPGQRHSKSWARGIFF